MNLRALEAVGALLVVIGAAFGGFHYLNEIHADRQEVIRKDLEIRAEILDRDIKKDAEARVYYKDKAKDGELDKADASRLEYLEEQLERKYSEQSRVHDKLMEFQ